MNYWTNVNYDSDKATISNQWDNLSVKYHYNFLENAIIRNLPECNSVLDIGSGYGHWLKFYKEMYDPYIEAMEPGENEYGVTKHKAFIHKTVLEKEFDVINAIGVLHHIMSEKDIKQALINIKAMMHQDSILFIGTRLDFIRPPKERVRNYRTLDHWKMMLDRIGFSYSIERSDPPMHCKKHLDLIICKLK